MLPAASATSARRLIVLPPIVGSKTARPVIWPAAEFTAAGSICHRVPRSAVAGRILILDLQRSRIQAGVGHAPRQGHFAGPGHTGLRQELRLLRVDDQSQLRLPGSWLSVLPLRSTVCVANQNSPSCRGRKRNRPSSGFFSS